MNPHLGGIWERLGLKTNLNKGRSYLLNLENRNCNRWMKCNMYLQVSSLLCQQQERPRPHFPLLQPGSEPRQSILSKQQLLRWSHWVETWSSHKGELSLVVRKWLTDTQCCFILCIKSDDRCLLWSSFPTPKMSQKSGLIQILYAFNPNHIELTKNLMPKP